MALTDLVADLLDKLQALGVKFEQSVTPPQDLHGFSDYDDLSDLMRYELNAENSNRVHLQMRVYFEPVSFDASLPPQKAIKQLDGKKAGWEFNVHIPEVDPKYREKDKSDYWNKNAEFCLSAVRLSFLRGNDEGRLGFKSGMPVDKACEHILYFFKDYKL